VRQVLSQDIGHRSGQSSIYWCWYSIRVVVEDKLRCVGVLEVVLETLTRW
jgi:hypothetical protein